MDPENFCYWLMGYFEIAGNSTLRDSQIEIIKNHLNLVFQHHIDPKAGGKEIQDQLNKIHSPGIKDVSNPVMRC